MKIFYKKAFFGALLFATAFVVGCASESTDKEQVDEVVEVEKKEEQPTKRPLKEGEKEVKDLRVEVGQNRSRTYYLGDELYNGTAIDYAKGIAGHIEYTITNGIMNRLQGYYPDGKPERDLHFLDGKSHGELRLYHPDGSDFIVEKYNKGELEGKQFRYYEGGLIWREADYEKGILKKEKIYSKDGTLIEEKDNK